MKPTSNSPSPMAELNSPPIHFPTTKRTAAELTAKKKNPSPKILSCFLYKAILFAVFVALLPLFPPQYPESANHNLLSQTWEILHLLLVGITVSYGLFSRRNANTDAKLCKEYRDATFKADTPNSYISTILQVSSVFDDHATEAAADESKIETSDAANYLGRDGKSPLLLPVRSLKKSRVQDSDSLSADSVVHPSPIPWRSRSGRMEFKDEGSAINATSLTPSFRSAEAPSPPTASASKTSEDSISIRAKRFYVAPTPPALPLPPPPRPCSSGSHFADRREVKQSFKDELKDLSRKEGEGFLKSTHLDAETLKSETSSSPTSVRTVRSAERAPTLLQQKYQTEEKKKVEFMEKMIIVSVDSKSKKGGDSSDVEEAVQSSVEAREAEENEVDRKADEFIARFREQIRLQRICSIKKSSGHRAVKNVK